MGNYSPGEFAHAYPYPLDDMDAYIITKRQTATPYKDALLFWSYHSQAFVRDLFSADTTAPVDNDNIGIMPMRVEVLLRVMYFQGRIVW